MRKDERKGSSLKEQEAPLDILIQLFLKDAKQLEETKKIDPEKSYRKEIRLRVIEDEAAFRLRFLAGYNVLLEQLKKY